MTIDIAHGSMKRVVSWIVYISIFSLFFFILYENSNPVLTGYAVRSTNNQGRSYPGRRTESRASWSIALLLMCWEIFLSLF